MRYIVPTLLALSLFAFRYGRGPLVDLTLKMAESAAYHQTHMMSLSSLNHALLAGVRTPAARHHVGAGETLKN